MKDILPGMTVHLPFGNYTDTTITVNGHKMTFTIVYKIRLGDSMHVWCGCWERNGSSIEDASSPIL